VCARSGGGAPVCVEVQPGVSEAVFVLLCGWNLQKHGSQHAAGEPAAQARAISAQSLHVRTLPAWTVE